MPVNLPLLYVFTKNSELTEHSIADCVSHRLHQPSPFWLRAPAVLTDGIGHSLTTVMIIAVMNLVLNICSGAAEERRLCECVCVCVLCECVCVCVCKWVRESLSSAREQAPDELLWSPGSVGTHSGTNHRNGKRLRPGSIYNFTESSPTTVLLETGCESLAAWPWAPALSTSGNDVPVPDMPKNTWSVKEETQITSNIILFLCCGLTATTASNPKTERVWGKWDIPTATTASVPHLPSLLADPAHS